MGLNRVFVEEDRKVKWCKVLYILFGCLDFVDLGNFGMVIRFENDYFS